MYCSHCGKEINDTACFCPYCGAKKAAGMPETKEETVRSVPPVSYANESEVLPVYKRKNKMAFLVAFLPLIGILFKTVITFVLFMLRA